MHRILVWQQCIWVLQKGLIGMDPPPERYLEPIERFWGIKKKPKAKVRNCPSSAWKISEELKQYFCSYLKLIGLLSRFKVLCIIGLFSVSVKKRNFVETTLNMLHYRRWVAWQTKVPTTVYWSRVSASWRRRDPSRPTLRRRTSSAASAGLSQLPSEKWS